MRRLEDLAHVVGGLLGTSDWIEIDHDRIGRFADLTGDRQSIHLDPQAGRAAGSEGAVAHGFLTLSILSAMSYQALADIGDGTASVNYGFDRVRFVAPVPAGARMRGHFTLAGGDRHARGQMLRLAASVEIEGYDKPALTADWMCLFLAGVRPDGLSQANG